MSDKTPEERMSAMEKSIEHIEKTVEAQGKMMANLNDIAIKGGTMLRTLLYLGGALVGLITIVQNFGWPHK